MAGEIATRIASGLFAPIYSQIDPVRVGEVARALSIAEDYGRRLDGNLKPGALERLVGGYPSHSFVIDCEEVRDLFDNVREPTTDETELAQLLKPLLAPGALSDSRPRVYNLTSGQKNWRGQDEQGTASADPKGKSGSSDKPSPSDNEVATETAVPSPVADNEGVGDKDDDEGSERPRRVVDSQRSSGI